MALAELESEIQRICQELDSLDACIRKNTTLVDNQQVYKINLVQYLEDSLAAKRKLEHSKSKTAAAKATFMNSQFASHQDIVD